MRSYTAILATLAFLATAACTKADDRITRTVQSRLAADPIVHGYHLEVNTDQKVVSLSGTVETSVAKDQALTLAKTAPNVAEVRDHIAIRDNEGTKAWLKKSNGAIGTAGHR
jgi:hypothetical protein